MEDIDMKDNQGIYETKEKFNNDFCFDMYV